MSATGVVREIYSVDSIVLPKKMMKSLGINNGDSIEFLLFAEDYIILRKHNTIENTKLTENEIRKNNAYNLNKIDETIRLLNNVKKLYKAYLGMD